MNLSSEIRQCLAAVVGQDRVKTSLEAAARYAVDGVRPGAVVFPGGIRETAAVLQCAQRHDLSVVPWGGGANIAMGMPPRAMDLVVSTERMNHLLDVDTANLSITVEAGVKFQHIQARLAAEEDRCYLPIDDAPGISGEQICSDRGYSGCFLPLDPPFCEQASAGGIIAANSTGPRGLLYGLPRDLLLGVRWVSPDGEIMGTGGKTVKNVSGYDLSKLMIGAMGTLGVLCEMTLRLLPLPERMETCILTFESLSHAMDFADRLFNTPLLPAAVEAVNRHLLQVVCEKQKGGPPAGSYGILIALEGVHEAVDRMHRELPIMAQQCGVMERIVLEEGAHSRFWREIGGLQAQAASRWSEMVSLRMNYPRAQWRSLVFRTEELLASSGMSHYLLCHAGSGVCRVDILLEGGARKEKEANAVSAVARTLLAACRAAGGNLTVPLAPTEMKPHLPVWGEPPPDLPLMRRVRFEMDPSERMSPGRTPWTPLLP